MRSSVLSSEARKASAAPWKLVRMLPGTRISFSAFSIASTASPSEARGARLKEIVVGAKWARVLIEREPERSVTFATAERGTCDVPLPEAIGAAAPEESPPLPAPPVVEDAAEIAADALTPVAGT